MKRLLFFSQIQNDQCQEMDQSSEAKWLKLTNHGEWATHTVRVVLGEQSAQLFVCSSAAGCCHVVAFQRFHCSS